MDVSEESAALRVRGAAPALAAAVALLCLVAGCASAPDAVVPSRPEGVVMSGPEEVVTTGPDEGVVERGAPYELSTHCGIDELVVDGRWYERTDGPLDIGGGNPPEGWDNPSQDGWLAVDGDRAVFTDEAGHLEEFTLRPGATEAKSLCS